MDKQWTDDDLRSAFMAGVRWWEWHQENATLWASDRDLAEDEAERRYPDGKLPEKGGLP